ncbi:hypothetical protein [Streptomyces uncialis]|uniref:hypothetical protein n=1 Tax=Streptomyces uncialis TaxID=1048205 RepID=UPI002255ED21|nr:hypothetical protein [Streptomyces uncialis]MCX4662590.1 hypothetical protein [Streptomyces uncialis]
MTSTLPGPGRLRRVLFSAPEESVPLSAPRQRGPEQSGPPPRHPYPVRATPAPPGPAPDPEPSPRPDPPLYRELLAQWTERGRALPGHPDPEWDRLTAPLVRPGEFGGTGAAGAPRGGGR